MTVPSHSSDRQKATIGALPTTDATAYNIYASTANKEPGENIRVLSAGSPTDKFVESLNPDKVITLSATPKPTSSFDASDQTLQWFKNIDSDATASLTVGEKDIETFEFKFSKPWPLVFSSASDVLLFTFGSTAVLSGDATGARIEPPGIDSSGATLTCGLDFVQMEDINEVSVEDIFKTGSQGDMTQYVAFAVLILPVTLRVPDEKAAPRRNALWFVPSDAKRVETRLQFQLPQFKALQDLFSPSLGGLVIDAADIVYKSKMVLEDGNPLVSGEVVFSIECSVKNGNDSVSMLAGVAFSPSTIDFTFTFITPDPLAGILKWLSSLAGDDSVESDVDDLLNKEEGGSKVFPVATLRRLHMSLDTTQDKEDPKLDSFSFDVEVTANFGKGQDGKPPIFLIAYQWDRANGTIGTLAGDLWNSK